MDRKSIYITTGSIVGLFLAILWLNTDVAKESDILVPVKKGKFEIIIMATGELEAKNFVKILAPDLRAARVFQVKIADLIPEGSQVSKGDYVASLDKNELTEKLHIIELEIQKLKNQFIQARIDTSLGLRLERDELMNRSYGVKEKENALKGMKFEPEAQIRQAEIELEKAKRSYQQAQENYRLRKQQASTKIIEVNSLLAEEEYRYSEMKKMLEQFTIYAPEAGMVIYHRTWNGQKRTVGSEVSAWDPAVATLPDMSALVSRVYVSEIDVHKVQIGQKVWVSADAFPNKKMLGEVSQIASIGEQKAYSDAKVFEVKIHLKEHDKALRPTMTTANAIVCESYEDALFIPLECLHREGEKLSYVFVKQGTRILKKQVRIGKSNDNEVLILEGLEAEEKVFLSVPEKAEQKEIIYLPPKDNLSQQPCRASLPISS